MIGVQESRARSSRCLEMGPFTRIIAAGENGQAGTELWMNGVALSRLFGVLQTKICAHGMRTSVYWQ